MAVQREVARPAVAFGELIQLMGKHVQLAGHGDLHDQEFLVVDNIGKGRRIVAEILIQLCKGAGILRSHEETVQPVQKFIARRAVGGPFLGNRLLAAEDFLNEHIERAR